jgi:hypothetical protein
VHVTFVGESTTWNVDPVAWSHTVVELGLESLAVGEKCTMALHTLASLGAVMSGGHVMVGG